MIYVPTRVSQQGSRITKLFGSLWRTQITSVVLWLFVQTDAQDTRWKSHMLPVCWDGVRYSICTSNINALILILHLCTTLSTISCLRSCMASNRISCTTSHSTSYNLQCWIQCLHTMMEWWLFAKQVNCYVRSRWSISGFRPSSTKAEIMCSMHHMTSPHGVHWR